MRTYGQFCPVAKAAQLFCERWTPLIIRDLAWGATRFSELQRGVPLMSPTLLSRRLKQLEAEGVVERRAEAGSRAATYHLTESGQEFAPIIEALGVWGQRWARRELAEGEIDLGLLIWALEKSVDPRAFGDRKTIVRLELQDQPRAKRFWWFVNEAGKIDLCLEDPGHDVDVFLAATLPDMIHIVRGDLDIAHALDAGRLDCHCASALRRCLAQWLNLGPLAAIKSMHRSGIAA
jgi:DNA-binding HxlR family transcriptional regulator